MCKGSIKNLDEFVEKQLKTLYEEEAKVPSLFSRKTGPTGNAWSIPVTKYQATKFTFKSKGQSGEKHRSFHEEAVVYVWHEKDVLNPAKMRPGHAAMKLSRYSNRINRNQMIRYISWWPGDGASKNTEAQRGSRNTDTRSDRSSEMSGDADVILLLKLQFIRLQWSKLTGGLDDFKDLAESQWDQLSKEDKDRLKAKFNCQDNFANLADLSIKLRSDQKFFYEMNDMEHNASLPEIGELSRARYLADPQSLIGKMEIRKQPYVRVYVPCSCLPASIIPGEVYLGRSPWGLSLDAMNYKFRSYEEGFRNYKMKGFDGNCIGAVWECMKSGLAEIISEKFRPAKGLISTIAHFQSLLPSDAINASIALSQEIVRLNKQQQYLDLRAYQCREGLAALAEKNKCFGEAWRNYVRLSALWRALSSVSGIRPSSLAPIDKLVDKYEKNERALGKKDEDSVQDLLKLEAVWESRYVAVSSIKNKLLELNDASSELAETRDNLEKLMEFQSLVAKGKNAIDQSDYSLHERLMLRKIMNMKPDQQAKFFKEQFSKLEKEKKQREERCAALEKEEKIFEAKAEPALKAWEQELENYEKIRRSRAAILLKLHEAVFAYVVNHPCSKLSSTPDARYFAVLLLGQFACWLYAETAHDNLSVRFRNLNAEGFLLAMEERDKRLGDAFPNLCIPNLYTGAVKGSKTSREANAKRDRILL